MRHRARFALALLALLLLAACVTRTPRNSPERYPPASESTAPAVGVDEALRGIDLTADQQRQVAEIERRYAGTTTSPSRSSGDWGRQIADIRAVLDPTQRVRFDRNLRRE